MDHPDLVGRIPFRPWSEIGYGLTARDHPEEIMEVCVSGLVHDCPWPLTLNPDSAYASDDLRGAILAGTPTFLVSTVHGVTSWGSNAGAGFCLVSAAHADRWCAAINSSNLLCDRAGLWAPAAPEHHSIVRQYIAELRSDRSLLLRLQASGAATRTLVANVAYLGLTRVLPLIACPIVADDAVMAQPQHLLLRGSVSYIAFDNEVTSSDTGTASLDLPYEQQVVAFVGQLSVSMSSEQASAVLHVAVGRNCSVSWVQQRQRHSRKLRRTGCATVAVSNEELAILRTNLNRRVLIDRDGFWIAKSVDQLATLCAYVALLKEFPALRIPNLPYDTVSVEEALSDPPSNTEAISDESTRIITTDPSRS